MSSTITIVSIDDVAITTASVVSILNWNQAQINYEKKRERKPSPHNVEAVWGMKKLLLQMKKRGDDCSGIPEYLLRG